jgi:hypothetical protein
VFVLERSVDEYGPNYLRRAEEEQKKDALRRYVATDGKAVVIADHDGRIVEVQTDFGEMFTERFVRPARSTMRNVLEAYGRATDATSSGRDLLLEYRTFGGRRLVFSIEDGSELYAGGAPGGRFGDLLSRRVRYIALKAPTGPPVESRDKPGQLPAGSAVSCRTDQGLTCPIPSASLVPVGAPCRCSSELGVSWGIAR